MEFLEERTLLSATPLSSEEYADLTAKYATFALPETMDDLNVVTLDLSEGDGLAELKAAIKTAEATEESDLIVVRTTSDANALTYADTDDGLTISLDSTLYGSLTIVGLGDSPLILDANQQSRVVTIDANNGEINFANMTFTNGYSTGAGGGLYIYGGNTVAIVDSQITGNRANNISGSYNGGGIRNYGGDVTLLRTMVSENEAYSGGGIYSNNNGTVTITDSFITDNTATYDGGGIYDYYGTWTITNSAITGNRTTSSGSSYGGGGIYGYRSTFTITASEISGNTAKRGGGIYGDGTFTITDSEISGNTATYDGGGICGSGKYGGGTFTITASEISGNTAKRGGGIYGSSGTLTITNSVIAGNTSASYGGGIYAIGTTRLYNATIAGNTATISGGGIYNTSDTARIYNTIIAENTAEKGGDVYTTKTLTGSNNLSTYEGWDLDVNYLYDPDLSLFADKENGDFSLVPNMQAFDRGSNEYAAQAGMDETWTDLAGNPRFLKDSIDIGAYEYVPILEKGSTVVTTEKDVVNAYDGATSLREAIAFATDGETVVFDESMRGKTIVLNGTQLEILKAVSIDAGDLNVTLDADGLSRVAYVDTSSKTPMRLKGLTFSYGGKAESLGDGGGIYHHAGALTVVDCVICNNYWDGIYSDTTGSLTVENSQIMLNYQGISFEKGKTLLVTNSAIFANCFNGISASGNNVLTLTNSTVVGNGTNGVEARGGGSFTVNNSIVTANAGWGDYADASYDLYGKAKATNSIVGTNDSQYRDTLKNTKTGVRNPGFSYLPDFANYEEWLNALEEDWDLTLNSDSMAVNAGDVKLFTKSGMPQTSSDLAGNARISGSKVDIGAYEFQSSIVQTPNVEVVKSGKKLTVSWEAVSGATSYLVEYRDVNTTKWTVKTVKNATSLAISAKTGTTYEIRVATVSSAGNSRAAVETVTVYAPLTTPKLKAIKELCKDDSFAVEVTNYAANLESVAESVTFGMNGKYETFDIENGSGSVRFSSGEFVEFSNGVFTVTNASSNTQYKLEIMFANSLTGSDFAKVNVKTTKTTYLAPTNLRITAATTNSISLDWSDSSSKTDATIFAQKYTVQYSADGGKTWKSVSVKTSEATISRLKPGTYLLRVLSAKDSKFEASLPSEILEYTL